MRKDRTPRPEEYEKGRIYDYSTKEGREATAAWLFQAAKGARTAKEQEWIRNNDYYNFIHAASDEVREVYREQGLEWDPAVVPDPYIQVESQIDPVVPEPEFRGRDDDMDSAKAKQREFAVRYIIQENRLEDKNTANERRLKKLGDAFWKAYWDASMDCGPYEGNIRVIDVPVEALYVDPAAGADGLEAAQYVDYVYTVHKMRFWQMYHAALSKQGMTLEDVMGGESGEKNGLFDLVSNTGAREDTVQVCEHWFRQPYDTKEAPAGAIGCSVLAGGKEVAYIPNYWTKTGRKMQRFPFVHYWCIRDENEFYNKSELEPILGLVDAADRALATGQGNDAMMANDIILVEEGTLKPGSEITNEPGAVVEVLPGRLNGVRRLGGLHDGINSIPMVNWMMEQIQRASRNYETNMGKESARVTTASGLAQLRSDADGQAQIKKADRNRGFARLYELLDALALEFFDDDRLLFIGARKEGEAPETIRYNGDSFALEAPAILDAATGQVVREAYRYWPRVDVTVTAGEGVARSKAATLEVLDKLSAIPVTAENWRILAAELEILDIPQKQEIIEDWKARFQVQPGQAPADGTAGMDAPALPMGGMGFPGAQIGEGLI